MTNWKPFYSHGRRYRPPCLRSNLPPVDYTGMDTIEPQNEYDGITDIWADQTIYEDPDYVPEDDYFEECHSTNKNTPEEWDCMFNIVKLINNINTSDDILKQVSLYSTFRNN